MFPRLKEYRGLDEVLKVYPKGLDFRDMIWIYKRMLVGVGFAHTQGYIHGALVPPHIMVDPIGHGAKLIDWCYAVNTKAPPPDPVPLGWGHLKPAPVPPGRVKAIVSAYKSFYAPEILRKEPVSPATDIYMLTKCAIALLGGDVEKGTVPKTVPSVLSGFLTSCIVPAPARRPQDAWELHKELDELLLKLVGKPSYRRLAMPDAT